MRCYKHSERDGVYTCSHCGEWMCEDCAVEVKGRVICKNCVAAMAEKAEGGSRGCGPHPRHHHHYYEGHSCGSKSHSGVLLFFLSFLPGLGHMYLGLIKRGLAVMSVFFGTIFMLTLCDYLDFSMLSLLLGLSIPIIFFTSFFDGFRLLRLENSGETLRDTADDLLAFIKKYRAVLLGSFGAMLVWSLVNNVLGWMFGFGRFSSLTGSRSAMMFMAVLVIGVGIYFLTRIFGHARRGESKRDGECDCNQCNSQNQEGDFIDKR